MSKVYILSRRNKIGIHEWEDILRACTEEKVNDLVDYAASYHVDMIGDPDEIGYYKGLVVYECVEDEEPHEYWATSE